MKENEKGKLPVRKKSSKSLKDRIHKHISDKNDVITEEDMKNIQIGEDSFEKEAGAEGSLPDEIDKDSDELSDAIKARKITSPWNVMTEDDK